MSFVGKRALADTLDDSKENRFQSSSPQSQANKRLKCESTDGVNISSNARDPLSNASPQSPCTFSSLAAKDTRFTVDKCDEIGTNHLLLTLTRTGSNSEKSYKLTVRDRWCEGLTYEAGATVALYPCDSLLSMFSDCIGNEHKDKVLILYPNFLVSGTTIVSSLKCKRRTVLNELFKRGVQAKPLLIGNILHQIFTACFQNKNFTRQFFIDSYRKACENMSFLESFYALDLSPETLFKELEQYISPIARLGASFLGKFPNRGLQSLGIESIVCEEVEKNVWSPFLGLKGKMDVLVDPKTKEPSCGKSDLKLVLELKTGRDSNSIEHQDQVRLYNKILEAEGISENSEGALVYLKTGNVYPVSKQAVSIRELMIIRNILVFHLTQSTKIQTSSSASTDSRSKLPDLEEDNFNCSNCDQRFNCGLMSRTALNDSQKPKLTELHADSFVVSPEHLKFFTKWYNLCLIEFPIMAEPGYSKIWMEDFQKSVVNGMTEGNLKLVSQDNTNGESCRITFVHAEGENVNNFIEGDRVLISSHCLKLVNVGSATVVAVNKSTVEVVTEQPILTNSQTEGGKFLWRLDKPTQEVSTSSTLTLMLSNLSQLMSQSGNSRVKRLRQLLLENEDAVFEETDKHLIPSELRGEAKAILHGLNGQQKLAVRKVLMSQDYTIIRGMPGSGKSTVIVAVIRLLVLCGHRILLTSFTNAAVDNVLLKLKSIDDKMIKIVRLGVKSRVHPDLRHFLPGANGIDYNAVAGQFDAANVVAGTVFNVNHPIFSGSKRKFSFCVVDEASQILLPLCIGPLFAAQRFVLVGDENQLAPLVSNETAKREGLAESLFQYIASRNSSALFSLWEQYRMNDKIMQLSNTLSYDGKMKAALPKVAERSLQIGVPFSCKKSCCSWMRFGFDPSNAAVFVDTSKAADNCFEERKNSSYFNMGELSIVHILLRVLKKSGVSMSTVGVICPYRQQLIEAQNKFCNIATNDFEGLEVHTVDKFQGRDKEVIILTCVRSRKETPDENEGRSISGNELLNDKRRVNVAVSRAKSKLFIVGDLKSLKLYQPMSVVIDVLTKSNCVVSFHKHLSDK